MNTHNEKLIRKTGKSRMKRNFSLFILLFSLTPVFAQTNLSTNENYVYSKTCMDGDCNKKSESVQYFDGLGRPIQSVAIKATPLGRDVVLPVEYDAQGRQAKNYYPVPQNGSQNGALYADPLANAPSAGYGNEKIYTEKKYDNLFAGRVSQVVPAGNTWSQKPVNIGYGTNIDNEVRKYTLTTTWVDGRTETAISGPVFYPANQLGKNTVTDPDGNTGTEFKNGKGETILVRKNDGAQNIDTYYLYNEYGQLVYVIPPMAVTGTAPDQATLDNFCYQYRYDGLGRLVEKKVPGKGWEYMIYDQQDRLVATQDANLREKGQWLYTKYDKFGRVTFTGINSGVGRSSEQAVADAYGSNNVSRTSNVFFNREGMDVYYDPNGTYPTVGWVKLLSVNYYDTYPAYSFNPPFPSSVFGKPVISDTGNAPVNTKAMPTLSLVKNIEDDNWTKNYAYYDGKGRLISTYAINHLGGYTKTETELDFAGVTQQSKVYHRRLSGDKEMVIAQSFDYDNQNRMVRHRHQVGPQPVEILAENTYNELSQITNKKVGNGLESMDYQYDIRGALTKINDPAALGNKLFGYELKYQNPSYTNIAPGKSNGNISEIDWKSASDGVLKRYSYTYDALNRLKDAVYTEPNTTNPYNNYYNEYATYDLNGNIKTLKRNAFPVTGTTATQVDDLVYQYTGNRLDKVIENALNDTGYEGGNNLIDYDQNGNMINMKDKGIQTIGYNFLSLPNQTSISLTNSAGKVSTTNIDHIYRADGTKLRKTTVQQAYMGLPRTETTDYLDGFQYTNIDDGQGCRTCKTESAYEEQAYRKVIGPIIPGGPKWTLNFIPTAEGFYSFTENRYIYQYKDHLGNVRISFARNSAGAPEITGTNNYYPFGLNHIGGGNMSSFSNYHSYKFGSKELQETGMYDFGARMYMPDLGRWGVIDPMAEAMRRYSPYNYAFNNPISFIDPDGMKPRQFAMPTDARPDAPSGWINPNWLGRGDAAFGSIDTGYNGGGGGAPMSAEGLLATAFNIGGTWNNTGFGLQNDTGTLLGYDGGYKSLNVNYGEGGIGDAVINIPEISLSGSSVFWGLQIQGHVNRYMAKWNAKSDFAWDRMKNSGRLNDHGVTFIGGAGDPAGIFDIAGQVMSTWKPENKYAAMAVGVAAALITRSPRVTGWLAYHEGPLLGHTIARHIGKTDADLINRLTTERRIAGASSFASESIAESVISSTINSNRGAIKTWINSGATTNLRLDYTGTAIIGRGIMRRVGVVNDLSNARIILKANGNGSYYILTAFPQ
ncbi:RNase A-like domain-containing protein [Chryseobacterium indologenes]|uniref:RNase A-like domain-containing protein n=3 Tax=Chryseobacterium indologenes TaxID=253 RepID=UPI001625932B|nr:RNase A-like domain-containing protein [Chryseobacterium indologenes]MBF6645860.1 RHS repeat-associated core domain-containing protein [Chryseobacterium indologenes]QQQ70475.1 RHS repeat-associated core domain-containing protein [Chryseobacterium indologenes]